MSFAVNVGVLFNAGPPKETLVLPTAVFPQLNTAERSVLLDWLEHAGARGIDTVIDLAVRPWKVVGADVVLGVFETGHAQASWLIVRYESGWAFGRCDDGFVSDVFTSLGDILALIDRRKAC